VFTTVRDLDLSNNQLECFDMTLITNVPLYQLNLAGNRLTPAVITGFQNHLPSSLTHFHVMNQQGHTNQVELNAYVDQLIRLFTSASCEFTQFGNVDYPFTDVEQWNMLLARQEARGKVPQPVPYFSDEDD